MLDNNSNRPLIVTAQMDENSFAFFDGLRRLHFPPERNFLAAHLTLFHKLPESDLEEISENLERIASVTKRIELAFVGWRSLGRGVAMNVDSPSLASVRSEISRRWAKVLAPQDTQPFRPHVTVQNKVEVGTARELLERLSDEAWPFSGYAEGLDLWHYLGGPWEKVEHYEFTRQGIE